MAFHVEHAVTAVKELSEIKAFARKKIFGEIEKQLFHQPTVTSKNKKCLKDAEPDFDFVPPLWQLRVGEYRVFYDVNEESETVFIRAVRAKPPEKRTQDIIQ